MPVDQVIRRAAKAGIVLSRAYVFQARSTTRGLLSRSKPAAPRKYSIGPAEKAARKWKAKLESEPPLPPPPRLPTPPSPNVATKPKVTKPKVTNKLMAANLESVLFAVVTRIGIARARQLLDQHEQALSMLNACMTDEPSSELGEPT